MFQWGVGREMPDDPWEPGTFDRAGVLNAIAAHRVSGVGLIDEGSEWVVEFDKGATIKCGSWMSAVDKFTNYFPKMTVTNKKVVSISSTGGEHWYDVRRVAG